MALIAKTKLLAFLYKIKIDGAFGEVKEIHDAVASTLAFIAVWIRNTRRPRFKAILWRAIHNFLAGKFKTADGRRPELDCFTHRYGNSDPLAHTDKLFSLDIDP